MRGISLLALAITILLTGCSLSPVSGRTQFIGLPEPICVAHSEIMFGLNTVSTERGEMPCADGVAECASSSTSKFRRQTARIALLLQPAAIDLYPSLTLRANPFEITVEHGLLDNSTSSASGKIALSVDLRNMDPSDDLVAFIIAREMGHVLNRHHEENTSSGVLGSFLIGAIVPVAGMGKVALSYLGSSFGSGANASQQQVDADIVALRILDRADYPAQSLALNLAIEAKSPQFNSGAWSQKFRVSAMHVVLLYRPAVEP